MRGRFLLAGEWLPFGACGFLILAAGQAGAGPIKTPAKTQPTRACRTGVLEGEVRAGESFTKPIGGGLQIKLEALSWGSGWLIRVLPLNGPKPARDYAELATPPYASVNPLLLSTDFSFRAQDAVAWNPRRFRFAARPEEFAQLQKLYEQYIRTTPPPAGAESELAAKISAEPDGILQILDARLVPGTANQAGTAALVATHFSTTAHTTEEPPEGSGTALGKLTWVRFRVTLTLPRKFIADPGMKLVPGKCP
jgi:hypothetical protein